MDFDDNWIAILSSQSVERFDNLSLKIGKE